MRYANDCTDPANRPMTPYELDQVFNLGACLVWQEDGYVVDYERLPDHSLRVELESRDFWGQVDPAVCACGATVGYGRDECLECALGEFGSEWQREQDERGLGAW